MRLTISAEPPLTSQFDVTYMAHFWFDKSTLYLERGPLRGIHSTIVTYCTIHKGPCDTKARPCATKGAATGFTAVGPLDRFERAVGRKIAFGRAIQSFPRHIRAKLWDAYHHVFPPPPTRLKRATRPQSSALVSEVTNATTMGPIQGGAAA